MNLWDASHTMIGLLAKMENCLVHTLGLQGEPCVLHFHSEVGIPTIFFKPPNRIHAARDKIILLTHTQMHDHLAVAMANCAVQRHYMIRADQYKNHPIPSKVPKPVLWSQGSARWNQYYIKLLAS